MVKRCFLFMAVILFAFFYVFEAAAQTDTQTPKESEIAGYLPQGLVVFLCFHDAKEPNLDKIKSDISEIAVNFKGTIGAVYVSGDDKSENKLREKFNIQPNETAVFIIQPSGKAVAKLTGAEITKTNLMSVVVSSCGSGGCGSGCGG